MSYTVFALRHLPGVVLLHGDIIVTAALKLAADRSGSPAGSPGGSLPPYRPW